MPLGETAGISGESYRCGCWGSSSGESSCPSWTVPFIATGPSPVIPSMVSALGNLPREADGLAVDEAVADEVTKDSSGIVDGPGSDTGGNSSSGVEDNTGETKGIVGKLLVFDEVEESGDLLASNEREILLRFLDDSELEEGSGSVIASSVIGLKTGSIGSGDSEISI